MEWSSIFVEGLAVPLFRLNDTILYYRIESTNNSKSRIQVTCYLFVRINCSTYRQFKYVFFSSLPFSNFIGMRSHALVRYCGINNWIRNKYVNIQAIYGNAKCLNSRSVAVCTANAKFSELNATTLNMYFIAHILHIFRSLSKHLILLQPAQYLVAMCVCVCFVS